MEDTTVYVGRASFRMTAAGDAADEHVVLFPPEHRAREGAGGTEQTKVASEGGEVSPVVNAALVTDFVANADTEEIIDTVAVVNTGSVGVADRIAQILAPQYVDEVADSGVNIKRGRNDHAGVVSGQQRTPLWIVASALAVAVSVMLLAESSIRESARRTTPTADRVGRPSQRGFVAPAVSPLTPSVKMRPPVKAEVDLASFTPGARNATLQPDSDGRRAFDEPSSKRAKPAPRIRNARHFKRSGQASGSAREKARTNRAKPAVWVDPFAAAKRAAPRARRDGIGKCLTEGHCTPAQKVIWKDPFTN